jgi:SNF2 family DNA or RNA helicase
LHLTAFANAARTNGIDLSIADSAKRIIAEFAKDAKSRRDAQAGTIQSIAPNELVTRLRETRFKKRELTDMQLRDLGRLVVLRHGANFSVPGAGKTAVTLALYELLRIEGRVTRLLVVAPKNAFISWEEEIDAVMDPPPGIVRVIRSVEEQLDDDPEIILCTYQRLPRVIVHIKRWMTTRSVHLVLDEAHRVKRGPRGVHGKAVLSIAAGAARRDILTGTPMPHTPVDIVAPLTFLWPSQENELFPDALLENTDDSDEAIKEVQTRIETLYVRTTKTELRLPDMQPLVQPVELSAYQKDIYLALRGELRESYFRLPQKERWDFQRLGRYWIYLVQAAVNPSLLLHGVMETDALPIPRLPPLPIKPGTTLFELLREYHDYEIPRKIEIAAHLARKTAPDGKMILWSSFVMNVEIVAQVLADLNPAVIHGGVPSSEVATSKTLRVRENEIAKFRTEDSCRLLVANPAACGEGISLHNVCHDAVYLDRTFNAGHFLQSIDRIHRLGLPPGTKTNVTILEASDTIDTRISQRLATKIIRMAEILDDKSLELLALDIPDDPGTDEDATQSKGQEEEDLRVVVQELEASA